MKKLFIFVALIGICFGAQAQSARQSPTPNAGSFMVKTTTAKGVENINVNYALIAPFTSILKFNLNTPNPMAMSVKVTDMSGKVVKNWAPASTSYMYESEIDISTLKAGTYYFNIYGANNTKLHAVSFIKQ